MSYLLTASPPDAALMQAAANGGLASPDDLETQARRLLANSPGATPRLVRLVREWMGIDSIGQIAKDMNWYPDFTSLNAAAIMDDETTSFITEVLTVNSGTVGELLNADYTIINPTSAVSASAITDYYSKFYGLLRSTAGETSLAGAKGGARIGILNQGAFPATYAHASTSAPVLRGVAIMRRLACINVPDPTTINLTVPPPPAADPSMPKTTRDLFDVHGTTSGGARPATPPSTPSASPSRATTAWESTAPSTWIRTGRCTSGSRRSPPLGRRRSTAMSICRSTPPPPSPAATPI